MATPFNNYTTKAKEAIHRAHQLAVERGHNQVSTLHLFAALLTIAWIASGITAGYLAYRWFKGGKRIFGKSDKVDLVAFLVSVVSGINLGIVGLGGQNIGMTFVSGNKVLFFITGAAYVWSAWQLWKGWKGYGKKVF